MNATQLAAVKINHKYLCDAPQFFFTLKKPPHVGTEYKQ